QHLIYEANCLSPSAVLMRKSLAIQAEYMSEDPEVVTAEDYDFWIRVSKISTKAIFLSEPLGNYVLHETNNSSSVEKHRRAVAKVVQEHAKADKVNFSKLIRLKKRLAFIEYVAARSYIDQKNWKKALSHIFKSIMGFPLFLRPYF